MAKRLFLAINLPKEVKEKIEEFIKPILGCPSATKNKEIRFIPSLNWHLTVSFLGYQKEELIGAILEFIEKTAVDLEIKGNKAVKVEFEKIILAPPGKKARMIWLIGTKETSKNIFAIKNRFENILIQNGVTLKKEYQPFNSHLTLARFHSQIDLAAKPRLASKLKYQDEIDLIQIANDIAIINNKIKEGKGEFSFFADKFYLMESKLHKDGPTYNIIKSVDFANN